MNKLDRRTLLAGLGAAALVATGGAGLALQQAVAQGAPRKIVPNLRSALIVVDVQNCFTPGGSLAVKQGDEIVPLINKLSKNFTNVVITQDWHTPGHVSFA